MNVEGFGNGTSKVFGIQKLPSIESDWSQILALSPALLSDVHMVGSYNKIQY